MKSSQSVLTRREIEIMSQVSTGLFDKEIADKIFISHLQTLTASSGFCICNQVPLSVFKKPAALHPEAIAVKPGEP